MDTALVIGGTRFIGRHLVDDLLEHDYDVTLFTRGTSGNPFADDDRVDHIEGDRTMRDRPRGRGDDGRPRRSLRLRGLPSERRPRRDDHFADCDAYVYVSSGAAYGREEIPKREGETPLHECTLEQATDDSFETYGNRKAEGDRAVFAAAEDGVRAMAVRPPIVYGPHDHTERLDWWIDRVNRFDRVVVPGDGTNLRHRVYVEDVASALRIVAERGAAARPTTSATDGSSRSRR